MWPPTAMSRPVHGQFEVVRLARLAGGKIVVVSSPPFTLRTSAEVEGHYLGLDVTERRVRHAHVGAAHIVAGVVGQATRSRGARRLRAVRRPPGKEDRLGILSPGEEPLHRLVDELPPVEVQHVQVMEDPFRGRPPRRGVGERDVHAARHPRARENASSGSGRCGASCHGPSPGVAPTRGRMARRR